MPDEKSVFVNDEANINKVIKPVPKPEKEIGIDTKEYIFQNIINAGTASALNVGEIERFTSVSHGREQVYKMLDAMGDDSKIAAVLETYAEDATEYNDKGRIVWVESSDSNIAAYVEFLLNSLCIDKNVYKWMYSLCKYGDVYLRLYRKSEYTDLLFNPPKVKEEILNDGLEKNGVIDGVSERKTLTENVKIKAYAPNDKYVHYVEMVPNPAEVFELTRFGKTAGYIKTSINAQPLQQPNNELRLLQQLYRYSFKQKDVELYSATEFVHACLDDGSNRTPEEVEIFLDPSTVETYKDYNPTGSTSSDGSSSGSSTSYSVKRGQSILYSSYKVWRELQLLETSVLLNRVTQSSISRIIQVEVGDMPKEMVGPHMQGIKQMIEQKAAINVGTGLDEYTAAGPIINNIYVPTHDGKGAISATAIGGDYKPGELVDLDYYLNCLYGGLRVPKQFFCQTDDATGFNGGTSLSIISSRYAKAIKRIQNVMCQAITDIVNLMLLDNDLGNYINGFEIKMLPPTTQDEKDRRENISTRVQLVRDVMDLLSDIDDKTVKMKVLKAQLATALSNQELNELLDAYVQQLEADSEEAEPNEAEAQYSDSNGGGEYDASAPIDLDSGSSDTDELTGEMSPSDDGGSSDLPSASDLGMDFTDSTQF